MIEMDKNELKIKIRSLKKLTWSKDRIKNYFEPYPWLVGCNFIPSTAINQLEMFQERDWNPERIELELQWAHDLGFNLVRVYLHYLLWENEKDGFFNRIDSFLKMCDEKGIKVLLVLFDDCWNQEPKYGVQPKPIPSVHNSGWAASPGRHRILDEEMHDKVLQYEKETLERFSKDTRIIGWDIYNEPGNEKMGEKTVPFLVKAFEMARKVSPEQPITAGIWQWVKIKILMPPSWRKFYDLQTSASDFISFHNYHPVENLIKQIKVLKKFNRPLMCTEYMSRPNSQFETHLPIFKKEGVHCINWGLVDGKTQTKWKWGTKEGAPEPEPWFHEIFRQNGTPYNQKEVDFIKSILS